MEELEKEKIRNEIKNLKRWWIQPVLSLFGLLIILATALFTNLSEYFKINSLNIEKRKVSDTLVETRNKFHYTLDSIKTLKVTFQNAEIKLSETFVNKENIELKKLKNKDEIIGYYKNQLDSLTSLIIKSKSVKKTIKVLSDEKGNIITDDKGNALQTE